MKARDSQNARRWPALASPIALVALAAAAGVAASGCGEVTYIQCEPGTVPQGSKCVPYSTGDDGGGVDDPGAEKDTADPGEPPKDPGPDEGEAADLIQPPDDDGGASDLPDYDGRVGAPCRSPADCDGPICLDWAGGYCTLLDCDQVGCPAGTSCASLPGGNYGCLADCTGEEDCRGGGTQACKTIAGVEEGDYVTVCYGLDENAGPVGSLCDDDEDCTGAGLCLAAMTGGYCSQTPCTAESCPEGSRCVKFDGQPLCMRACAGDGDCGGSEEFERKCSEMKDVSKTLVDVCVSGTAGRPVGEPCQNGFECATGTCQVLGDGRCSQTSYPCFEDGDCPGVEFCNVAPGARVGRCTQECSVAATCPGASFCVGTPGDAKGFCSPSCDGVQDIETCPNEDGFSCLYGFALGDSTAQGRYLCGRITAGGIGWACQGGQDCDGGACQEAGSGEASMCVAECDLDGYCPFTSTCASLDGATMSCQKACLSLLDCPAGFTCASPAAGGFGKVCR